MIALVVLQVGDALTTVTDLNYVDGVFEFNPVMSWAITWCGLWVAVALKVVIVSGALLCIYKLIDVENRESAATVLKSLSAATFFYFLVVLNNFLQLYGLGLRL